MNDVRTVAELEQTLRSTGPELLQPVRLSAIRTEGRRRRRTRVAAVAAGTAAAVVAAGFGVATLTGGGDGRGTDTPVAAEHPTELSPLVRRVLAEVPGAVQVSDWQVVIPLPDGARSSWGFETDPPQDVDVEPVDIGIRDYQGVTAYQKGAFPRWLYDGVDDWEVAHGEDGGHPVGSTDMGIVVDAGPAGLACLAPLPDPDAPDGCYPAVVGGVGDDLTYHWGMGTDDFLQEGEDLELFSTDTFVDGTAQTVWIGGTYGTDVASVDLVTTDGTTVSATVASGTLVPGDTMFWGTVDGELARAVTRDADGDVLEDHKVKECSDPVDCEVR